MAKKKKTIEGADSIKESIGNIREECNNIDAEIEDKSAETKGDPTASMKY